MNNDFLWDGTGSDPEIEALEAKLGVFRSSSSSAPRIPRKRRPFLGHFSGFRIRTGIAAFASAALVIASLTAYVDLADESRSASVMLTRPVERVTPISVGEELAAGEAPIPARDTTSGPITEVPSPQEVTIRRKGRNRPRQPKGPVEEQLASFSDEERAAYEQLMLALSITSSGFRLVQEKIGATSTDIPIIRGNENQNRSN